MTKEELPHRRNAEVPPFRLPVKAPLRENRTGTPLLYKAAITVSDRPVACMMASTGIPIFFIPAAAAARPFSKPFFSRERRYLRRLEYLPEYPLLQSCRQVTKPEKRNIPESEDVECKEKKTSNKENDKVKKRKRIKNQKNFTLRSIRDRFPSQYNLWNWHGILPEVRLAERIFPSDRKSCGILRNKSAYACQQWSIRLRLRKVRI